MNNDNIQKLVLLCHKMQQEGVTPSVGMLRSKAPFKVSVTEAIETIKRFNVSSAHTPKKVVATNNAEQALSERVAQLENEVELLKRSLSDVIKQLSK
ncbi:hypothetical protein MTsDn1_16100 [Alteromonas sp. MTD1]|jgi:hypothetical protein|uniref:hypothetical protein n=1 Tax=unclassified Alteromonas TaxID=2614992 RepID=UPI002EC9C7CD|nr:hypothetical protein [Pseudomonadota bacterium]